MNTDLLQAAHTLAKGGLFRIRDGQGRRVECLAGFQNDVDGFTIDRAGDTFLSALADSRFVVLCPSATARPTRATECCPSRRPETPRR